MKLFLFIIMILFINNSNAYDTFMCVLTSEKIENISFSVKGPKFESGEEFFNQKQFIVSKESYSVKVTAFAPEQVRNGGLPNYDKYPITILVTKNSNNTTEEDNVTPTIYEKQWNCLEEIGYRDSFQITAKDGSKTKINYHCNCGE